MRELKFRAWDEQTKKMWHSDGTPLPMRITFTPSYISCQGKSGYDPGANHIMQYTGLKDKNGKEIYEGDIVVGWNGIQYLVMWEEDGYTCLDFKAWEHGYYDAYVDLSDIGQVGMDKQFTNEKVEVIGNAHETPELLPKSLKD